MWSIAKDNDEWVNALDRDAARYHPAPSSARISLYLPESVRKSFSSKEERDAAHSQLRKQVFESCVRIQHDPESPYALDIHFNKTSETDHHKLSISRCVLTRLPLILFGRYVKRSRCLSQTPMFVDAGKRRVGTSSVQELIAGPILHEFYAAGDANALKSSEAVSFAGAGREDVDVQVFGEGRAFILTIPDPTNNGLPSNELLKALETRIIASSNDLVRVSGLKIATTDDKKYVLEGAEQRKKLYVCVVELEKPLSGEICFETLPIAGLKDLKVFQRTPVRVAHRRSMMVRERMVHSTRAVQVSPSMFILWIEAGAGFYIKEFVHGDLGRTSPSVSEMFGCRARLVTLDFLGPVSDEGNMTGNLEGSETSIPTRSAAGQSEDENVGDSKRLKPTALSSSVSTNREPLDLVEANWFW